MRRFLVVAVLSLAVFFGSTGCFSFVDWSHNKMHLKAWEVQLRSFHKSFDRLILDYDWDDPTLHVDDGFSGM